VPLIAQISGSAVTLARLQLGHEDISVAAPRHGGGHASSPAACSPVWDWPHCPHGAGGGSRPRLLLLGPEEPREAARAGSSPSPATARAALSFSVAHACKAGRETARDALPYAPAFLGENRCARDVFHWGKIPKVSPAAHPFPTPEQNPTRNQKRKNFRQKWKI